MQPIIEQLGTQIADNARQQGWQLYTSLATAPIDEHLLSQQEKQVLHGFKHQDRKQGWRRGRQALKPLMEQLGLCMESGDMQWPQSQFSLTHSRDYALAIGSKDPLRGIGVDLEIMRTPKAETARFFLTPNELDNGLHAAHPLQAQQLLKLWCIKEAAYKANPKNRHTMLADYQIEWQTTERGSVSCKQHVDYRAFFQVFALGNAIKPSFCALAIFP